MKVYMHGLSFAKARCKDTIEYSENINLNN